MPNPIKATITATSKYLPEKVMTNHDLEKVVETNHEWIVSRTGISERRVVEDGQATADMCTRVAKEILLKRAITADDIDVIIIGTVTPDMLFPSTAALVQDAIGASNAWGYDLSGACSGFLFALENGVNYIETGRYNKVLVLGAGVAGLQAIATAKRLGAQVEAFDVRPIVKEQVESLGAKFIEVESAIEEGVGEGGYAKETSEDYKRKQQELIHDHISNSDVVITTALIPGKPAPLLISKSMVQDMRPGSVIMDLAAENGGNCELTKKDDVIESNQVIIDGTSNFPATMPVHASELYAKNVAAFLLYTLNDGKLNLDLEDEIISGAMFTHQGKITHQLTQEAFNQSKDS